MEQVRTRKAFIGPEGSFKKSKVITVSAARARELVDSGFAETVTKTEAKAAEPKPVKPAKATTK